MHPSNLANSNEEYIVHYASGNEGAALCECLINTLTWPLDDDDGVCLFVAADTGQLR